MAEALVHIRIYTFGTLSVERKRDDGTWEAMASSAWGSATYGSHTKSLLSYLLCCSQRQAFRGSITDELWGSDLPSSDDYMQRATSRLRQILGREPYFKLTVNRTKYTLADQSLLWVDADHCKTLLEEAKRIGVTTPQGLALLQEAEYYFRRGRFLEEETGLWIHSRRGNIQTLSADCVHWLLDSYEAQGQYKQLEDLAEYLLREDPMNEYALCYLMTALHKRGMTSESLRRYREIATFAEKTGIVLSSDIQILARRLQNEPRNVMLTSTNMTTAQTNDQNMLFNPLLNGNIQGPGDSIDLFRRKFLQDTGAMLFPFLIPSGQKNTAALNDVVLYGNNIVKACWHLMKGKEIITAEELLSPYIPTLLNLVFQPSPYQQKIAQIATQACMIRAIIAKHYLNPIAREMYCHEAIQCSRLSGDKVLYAGALMYLGYTYTFCNPIRPQKAIETFLEALRELENIDSLVKSDICIGLADAYALMNDESHAKHAIHMAQDSFPSHPEQHVSFFYADCALDTLYQWEAKMYLDLAQHDQRQDYYKRALTILEQSTKIHAVSERCIIETVIYQTTAALGLHDLDRYASCLKEGALTALQIGSQRRYQEAFDLYQQAPKDWKQEPQTQDIATFFQESHRREKQAWPNLFK